jgi:SAM-dependent methyltransferase
MIALAAVALGVLRLAAEPGGPNAKYLRPDLDVDAWVKRFETPGREVFDKRKEIVAATGVRPGAAVADVGAGTGLYTMLFSAAVGPRGKVYAVDIAAPFLAHIARRAAAAGARNVEVVRGTARSIALPRASVDLVFVCDTYHHFEHPQDTLASIRRALRPGGALVVVDYRREPGKSAAWVVEHVRADQAAVTAEIEAAGFVRQRDVDDASPRAGAQQPVPARHDPLLRESYFLMFRPAPPGAAR